MAELVLFHMLKGGSRLFRICSTLEDRPPMWVCAFSRLIPRSTIAHFMNPTHQSNRD
jgi:hypothetical protein